METLGTDWGRRMISPGLWANAVEIKIRAVWRDCPSPIVIDDMRFPSDWSVIERLGGILVRIVRPGVGEPRTAADHVVHRFPAVRRPLAAIGFSTLHETEYHWHDAPADLELMNGSTVDALEGSLADALSTRGIDLTAAGG